MIGQKKVINDVVIAPAEPKHAQRIAILSEQLGYSATSADILRRIHAILDSSSDAAYVALVEDHLVVGWIHVFYTLRLETAPFCEIGGLVVHEEWRGKGIGGALVEHAKIWTGTKGIDILRVRSNVIREDAHNFYLGQGFLKLKQQAVFEYKE
jgi:GNAT superfamily N-acetyltransferase